MSTSVLDLIEAMHRRIGHRPTCQALAEEGVSASCGNATTHVRLVEFNQHQRWASVCPEHLETPWID